MKTAFSHERMAFTKRAHLAAQRQFYAPMFGHRPTRFEDTVGTKRDLEYAIDCQLAVTVDGLKAPLRISVQERWREPSFMRFGDVTVTEWNKPSGLPSELHKFGAQLFVYGFYDDGADRIVAGVALAAPMFLCKLAIGELLYERQSRIDQTFLSFRLTAMQQSGAVVFQHRSEEELRE